MRWQVVDLGGGYRRIDGAVYALYVAVTDEVAEAEHDGFLRLFSRLQGADPEAARWVRHWMKESTMTQKIEDIPGYDDIFDKILEELPPQKRMLGLTPEQRVAGLSDDELLAVLTPERLAVLTPERLAGLSEEQRVLALSDETLRQLPDSYLRTPRPQRRRRSSGASAGPWRAEAVPSEPSHHPLHLPLLALAEEPDGHHREPLRLEHGARGLAHVGAGDAHERAFSRGGGPSGCG